METFAATFEIRSCKVRSGGFGIQGKVEGARNGSGSRSAADLSSGLDGRLSVKIHKSQFLCAVTE